MLKIGKVIAPIPPMEWNSWNNLESSIPQQKEKATAE
jgi:hypothetical protein